MSVRSRAADDPGPPAASAGTAAAPPGAGTYLTPEAGGHHAYTVPAILGWLPAGGPLAVLDAGCGNGHLAGRIAALGHRVHGCEISATGVAMARRHQPGVTVFEHDLYEPLDDVLSPGTVDVVVACEVIEHLYEPQRFLGVVNRVLRPDGHLILTTPYHGYVKNVLIGLTGGWDRHFMADEVGGHIKFFSPRTLRRMLAATGFDRFAWRGAGRGPPVWSSMAARVSKAAEVAYRPAPSPTAERLRRRLGGVSAERRGDDKVVPAVPPKP